MKFRGHTLLWANNEKTSHIPGYIRQSTDKAYIESFIKDYIEATISFFKGKAYAWDVINEAISPLSNETIRPSPYT